jgi:AcrR family transcriptional regulator
MNSIRSGRRPGPSHTREAIEAAARSAFSERGYDRTTVRAVARSACVDPALVFHFFGSKAGLFAAAMRPPFDAPALFRSAFAGDVSRAGERLARGVVDMLEEPASRARIVGIVRAAATEPSAARLVRELIAGRVYEPLAAALGGGADAPLRATLVGSQIVGLVMARYVVGLEPLASAPRRAVEAALAPVLQRYLTGPLGHTLGEAT